MAAVLRQNWQGNAGTSVFSAGREQMSLRTRFVGLLVLGASVIGPAASAVSAAPSVSVRVYDREYRDYHRWDSREQRSYRQYLAERHQAYVRYQRQRQARQREYWRWRHERLEHERR
jgi:hypothetical protein